MNMKKFEQAMVNLEQLHWHMVLNDGWSLWTAELLRQFQAAISDNSGDEPVILSAEPPQPAA